MAAVMLSFSVNAQYVNLKGGASIKFQTTLTGDDKERAITAASMNAIERYFSEKGEAQDQVFESSREKIEKALERLVQNTAVLSEQVMQDTKRYQVTVRVELNEARLKNLVKQGTAATMSGEGEKSNIVYLFTARQANSVKQFDDRVVRINQVSVQREVNANSKVSGTEGEKISGNQVSTNTGKSVNARMDGNATVKRESGGSVTSKSDEIGYQVLPMGGYKPAVTSIFTQSGFVALDSDFVLTEADIKSINADYANGNDISPTTLRNVFKTLKASQEKIKFLVIATIDVGLGSVDGSSGMRRIGVEVSGRVLGVEGNIPREIASVPPVQQASLGVDDATFSLVSNAQLGGLGGLGGLLGGGGGGSGPAPDKLLAEYFVGTAAILNANSKILTALGMKEAADAAASNAANMKTGATTDAIKEAEKVQTESSKLIQEKLADKNLKLDDAAKKQMGDGYLSLAAGSLAYIVFIKDVKEFKPSVTSIGASALALAAIVPRVPEDTKNLLATYKAVAAYAKENKIPAPSEDPTKSLAGLV
eukprot:gene13228-15244_t